MLTTAKRYRINTRDGRAWDADRLDIDTADTPVVVYEEALDELVSDRMSAEQLKQLNGDLLTVCVDKARCVALRTTAYVDGLSVTLTLDRIVAAHDTLHNTYHRVAVYQVELED